MKAKENLIKIQKEISPIKNRGEIRKIPLGAVREKELKRELKLLKVLAVDPIIKEMTRTRSFAQWGGAIEYYDGTVVSVLLVDHFGTRTAYGISPELMDTPEALAELRDKPKQLTDWIHVADLVNGAGRNKIIGRQKLSVEQVQEDGGLKGDTTSFPAWAVGIGVEAVLWGSREVSAALIAAIDEQMHTIGKCSTPETKYIFEVPDERAADWLRSLMEALAVRPGALSLHEEAEGTLVLGPNDGEEAVVHLPLDGECPLLTREEKDVLAEYVLRCLDDNVLAEVEQEWQNSVDSKNTFVNSLAEEWRMLLVFYVPDVVFKCVEGKHVMGALNALEGILWPEYPAF